MLLKFWIFWTFWNLEILCVVLEFSSISGILDFLNFFGNLDLCKSCMLGRSFGKFLTLVLSESSMFACCFGLRFGNHRIF